MNHLVVKYNGTTYEFFRNQFGQGDWYCVDGKVPGSFGNNNHLSVPVMMSTELVAEAVRQGLACSQDLARIIKKEKAEKKKVSVSSKNRKKSVKVSGGFNPFKTTFRELFSESTDSNVISSDKESEDEDAVPEIFAGFFEPTENLKVKIIDFEEIESEEIK